MRHTTPANQFDSAPSSSRRDVGRSTKGTRVLTVDSHGAQYFYYALQAAVLLARRNDCDVTVVFLPSRSLTKRTIDVVRRNLRRRKKDTSAYRAFQRGERVEVEHDGRTIRLQKAQLTTAERARAAARGAVGALRVWLASFPGGRFSALAFLETHHRDTRVGDMAAATFFRGHSSAFDLTARPLLLYWLWRICSLIELTEIVWATPAGETYALSPEPGFIQNAPQRHLRSRGAPILDLYHPSAAVAILGPGVEQLHTHGFPDASLHHSAASTADVNAYLQARLFDTPRVLGYMTTQNRNDEETLLDFDGQPVTLRRDVLYPVLFLHSLGDLQYCFGLDGFPTLGDWTFRTIEMCLGNPGFASVLIKPHPAGSEDESTIDGHLLSELRRRYAGVRRVIILRPDASLVRLATGTRIVGITHHGSVAEELTYLGQPVIASKYASWGDRYRFLRVWSSPREYSDMLQEMSIETWSPPTDDHRAELERFVRDFRLSELPSECRDPAWLLAKLRVGLDPLSVVPPSLWHLREGALSSLDDLDQESEEFGELMNRFSLLPMGEVSDHSD